MGMGGENQTEKVRNDSIASIDSGIGDCYREVDYETGLEVISLQEVSLHDTREDGWLVIYDKTYNGGWSMLWFHPQDGGDDIAELVLLHVGALDHHSDRPPPSSGGGKSDHKGKHNLSYSSSSVPS